MSQISFFDGSQPLKIDKPIRLIELFAGYGSQHLALRYLGADVESYRICEWAVKSIQAYKDLHMPDDGIDYSILSGMTKDELIDWLFAKGISADYNQPMTRDQIKRMGEKSIRRCYNNITATHNLVSITTAHGADLGVTDTDRYCYIVTYSFPCQDLSLAGLGKGMSEGSGTRSGMLWEVRRLLEETPNLPQILLMENVTQVHGTKNMDDFLKWQAFLNGLGYKSYWMDMNAKDYGVPQNRDRCFMVSFLGDYYYDFPQPFKLEKRLKDLLEPEVDAKYYLSQEALNGFVVHKQKQEEQGNSFHAIIKNPDEDESASTIKARYYKDGSDCLIEEEVKQIMNVCPTKTRDNPNQGRVYDDNGLCPALTVAEGGNRQPMVLDEPREAEVIGGIGDMKSNGGTQFFQQDRVYEGDIALSHPASLPGGSYMYAVDEPFICASRGRNEENPSDRTKGIELHQRLEPNYSGCSNTLTSVDKDNYLVTPHMRIRKLTPRECFRLMGVRDEDFDKVRKNQSDSSLYHLAGDSICVDCMMEIFKMMM